jgi:hypothetical protein
VEPVTTLTPPTTPRLKQDDAETLLEPYLAEVRECYNHAWEAWETFGETLPNIRRALSPSARARFIYDMTTDHARRVFGDPDRDGVRVLTVRGLFVLDIEGIALVRFKKLRPNLTTSGIPTGQAQLFAYQQQLPGMPLHATKLVAGYLLNPVEDEISRVLITCSVDTRLEWAFEIPPDGGAQIVQFEPAPVAPPSAIVRSTTRKREEERSDEKDDQ